MFGRFIVFCSIIHRYFMIVEADVSHFKTFTASTNNNQFSVFDGYQYDPPSLQLPSPAPPPLTTFIPQIVANKGIISAIFLLPTQSVIRSIQLSETKILMNKLICSQVNLVHQSPNSITKIKISFGLLFSIFFLKRHPNES